MTNPPSEAVKETWQLRNAIAELFRPDDFRDTKWQNVFFDADALITAHDAKLRREALLESLECYGRNILAVEVQCAIRNLMTKPSKEG